MTTKSRNKPPVWFWIVSVIALLWNAMGVKAYLEQAYDTEGFRNTYNAEQLEIMANQPSWYTAAFAIAVFGATLGCIALLMKKKVAKLLFLLSLIGIIGQLYYNLVIIDSFESFGTPEIVMTVMIPIVALLLLWLSKKGIAKGWLS